jgi:hypothetical protein
MIPYIHCNYRKVGRSESLETSKCAAVHVCSARARAVRHRLASNTNILTVCIFPCRGAYYLRNGQLKLFMARRTACGLPDRLRTGARPDTVVIRRIRRVAEPRGTGRLYSAGDVNGRAL